MSLASSKIPLNSWSGARPSLGHSCETDTLSLSRYIQAGENLLAMLPPKSCRSPEQAHQASVIHESCRSLRRHFLTLYADNLYTSLTNGYSARKSLRQLAFDAAISFPGLVPTPQQLMDERAKLQIDKEGREIDQGLFFHALLRSPTIGVHLADSALQPTTRAKDAFAEFHRNALLDLGSVLIEKRGSAAHITINNSYCLNAEDDRSVDDMETAVDLALLDDEVRVGVIRGGFMTHKRYIGRRVFSAGINLKALYAGQISYVDFILRREFGYINKLIRGFFFNDGTNKRGFGKPWIAAVDSFAIGGGAQLLLALDHIVADENSYFSVPAAKEGIIPGLANLRLARFMGRRKARQVILYGRQIWAHEPDGLLLFDEVIEPAKMDLAIERNIQRLSEPGVRENRHMLNLAEEPLEMFLHYAAEFALVQAELLYSEDVLGKVRGFAEA